MGDEPDQNGGYDPHDPIDLRFSARIHLGYFLFVPIDHGLEAVAVSLVEVRANLVHHSFDLVLTPRTGSEAFGSRGRNIMLGAHAAYLRAISKSFSAA